MALIEEAGEAQGHAHAHTHGDKPCSGHDNAAEKAKPAEKEPEMPDLFKTARQLVMLPVLYFSNKMDWKNEFNSLALQVAFSVVAVALFAIIQLTLIKIAAKKDERRVQNPGFKFKDKLAEDGTVSYQEYDSARTQEVRLQLLMSAVIGAGVYLKWEMAHPLIAMCVMQPLSVYDLPAVHIHLLGKTGPEYERPWASAGGDNPLAAWAEKKNEEMAAEQDKTKTIEKSKDE